MTNTARMYQQFALTPPSTKAVRPHGLQNVGYSGDMIHLLRVNKERGNIRMFGGYRLWGQLPSGDFTLLEQCTNGQGVLYANDPGCYRTPAGRYNWERHIQHHWSVQDYARALCWNDEPGHQSLTDDPEYWAAQGVTTAGQLADYVQGCHLRNMEKSAMG